MRVTAAHYLLKVEVCVAAHLLYSAYVCSAVGYEQNICVRSWKELSDHVWCINVAVVHYEVACVVIEGF